jgi:hypothetical protein
VTGFRWPWSSGKGSSGNRHYGERWRRRRRGIAWSKGLGQIRTEFFCHCLIKITCAAVDPDNFSLVGFRHRSRVRAQSRMARLGRSIMCHLSRKRTGRDGRGNELSRSPLSAERGKGQTNTANQYCFLHCYNNYRYYRSIPAKRKLFRHLFLSPQSAHSSLRICVSV